MKVLLTILILQACVICTGQTLYQQTSDSHISVTGTSTLHEWTLTSEEGKYEAIFKLSPEGYPIALSALTIVIECESLKSEHTAMDANTYSTLDSEEYKEIVFQLVSAELSNSKIQCTGNLTVSGVTKLISLETQYKTLPNHTIICTGIKKLKMSDFNIDAPSFVFGTIRTGDEIIVSFKVILSPAKHG